VNVFVDGHFGLSLALSLVQEKGLRAGMPVDPNDLAALGAEDERRVAYDAAIHLLSYRPRSEREMRQRLRRRGVTPEVIEETVRRLLESHYLDDAAFANFWRENREAISPRSARLIRSELLSRGIDVHTATSAVEGLDDEESAYRAAAKRLKGLRGQDADTFRQRLGGFLTRRGFSYDVTRRVIERCWQEIGGNELSS
jgi:regulatory protein